MAAISKAWVTVADAAVDPDSPGDATLMTGIRDNLVHLREWIGASFFAGAVQDHNHDGSNSALVQVGANLIRNGSFEEDGTGWTITDYSGGSHAFSTIVQHHGAKSLSFTSTSTANGGGDALSNEFIPVTEGHKYRVDYMLSASVANVSSRVQVVWYDKDQAQISAVNVYDLTDTPTARTHYSSPMIAPATARFARLKLIGGVPGAGSATGTIYFDGTILSDPPSGLAFLMRGSVASPQATLDIVMTQYAGYGAKLLVMKGFLPSTSATNLLMRVSANGGTSYDTGASQYGHHSETGNVTGGTASGSAGTGTSMQITGSQFNGGSGAWGGKLWLYQMNDANQRPGFFLVGDYRNSANDFVLTMQNHMRLASQITNAIRFIYSSGNIAAADWELYGYL